MDPETKTEIDKLSQKMDKLIGELTDLSNKVKAPPIKWSEWVLNHWGRLSFTLVLGVLVAVVMSFAGYDVHNYLRAPASQNLITQPTIPSNIVISCYSPSNGVLSAAISGTNSFPCTVTVIATTSTQAITEGQWYALILLLTPLVLAALVTVLVFRKSDDD